MPFIQPYMHERYNYSKLMAQSVIIVLEEQSKQKKNME